MAAGAASWGFTRVARVGLLGFVGVVAALFAAADAAMGPQTFEDHFGGGSGGAGVFAVFDAEFADVVQQALDLRELLVALLAGS